MINTLEPYLNQVTEGDCLEVMQDFPPNSIDLILCDLPYGTTINPWDTPIDFPLTLGSISTGHQAQWRDCFNHCRNLYWYFNFK